MRLPQIKLNPNLAFSPMSKAEKAVNQSSTGKGSKADAIPAEIHKYNGPLQQA